MKSAGRSMKETGDVARARQNVAALEQQLADLEAKFHAELLAVEDQVDPMIEKLDSIVVKPKKANISVRLVVLAWAPFWQRGNEAPVPAWR